MNPAYPGLGLTLGLELALAPALPGQATLSDAVDAIVAQRAGRHPDVTSRPVTDRPVADRPVADRSRPALRATARRRRPASDGLLGRFGRRLSAWRERRRIELTLSALRAWQLADIGIDPADIPTVARAIAAGTYRPPGWDVQPHRPIRNDDAPPARRNVA